jgi:NAD/NADP transhydrogenase beta subunit
LVDFLPAVVFATIWAYSAITFRWDLDLLLLTGVLFAGSAHILTTVLRWGNGRLQIRVALAAMCSGGALAGWAGTELHMMPEGVPAHWSAVFGLVVLVSLAWWIREKSAHPDAEGRSH